MKPYRNPTPRRDLDDGNPAWVIFCFAVLVALIWIGAGMPWWK